MSLSFSTGVHAAFFAPLDGLAAVSAHARQCPEFSDADWLAAGLGRCLEKAGSGRGFLQEHGLRLAAAPTHSNYFHSLHSERRLELLAGINASVLAAARLPDRLAELPELQNYECFALDGHWHQAATHDPRHGKVKMPVGHFYSLDLRGHQLRHLAAAEGLHEHDLHALKRAVKPTGLRHGVPKGKKVLVIYDKAGIDLAFWNRCRREKAVYFLSRLKENMVYEWIESRPLDPKDPHNAGVQSDRRVRMASGDEMRVIHYIEPALGKSYEFLTNDLSLPAGVLAELYRRRWELEKVFDEIKNKLGEKKAWGTSQTARQTQAQFIVLTHNLLLIYENRLEVEHGVVNAAEDRRRAGRQQTLAAYIQKTGREISSLVVCLRRATQRSVKFLRWLRQALRERLTEEAALPLLHHLYASL